MITYDMLKKAINAYQDELQKLTETKPYGYFLYELFVAEVEDITNNNHFVFQLSKIISSLSRKYRDHNEHLTDSEFFALLNLLVIYKGFADSKQLICALNKVIYAADSTRGNAYMTSMVNIMAELKEVDLFTPDNLSKLIPLFKKADGLFHFGNLLGNFKQLFPPTVQNNFDIMIKQCLTKYDPEDQSDSNATDEAHSSPEYSPRLFRSAEEDFSSSTEEEYISATDEEEVMDLTKNIRLNHI